MSQRRKRLQLIGMEIGLLLTDAREGITVPNLCSTPQEKIPFKLRTVYKKRESMYLKEKRYVAQTIQPPYLMIRSI